MRQVIAGGLLPFVWSSKNSNGESNSAGDSNEEEAKYLLYGWSTRKTETDGRSISALNRLRCTHKYLVSSQGINIDLDSKDD